MSKISFWKEWCKYHFLSTNCLKQGLSIALNPTNSKKFLLFFDDSDSSCPLNVNPCLARNKHISIIIFKFSRFCFTSVACWLSNAVATLDTFWSLSFRLNHFYVGLTHYAFIILKQYFYRYWFNFKIIYFNVSIKESTSKTKALIFLDAVL